ncbi:hypothetical protein HZB01_02850 [Candidatus Woesearchaeota archaeon]|nr:hypothetical protein [Candidatus Woesearchaeota archaeon]
MTIITDSLKILEVLYNHKIRGEGTVCSDDPEITRLGLSNIELTNATEYLNERKFVKVSRRGIHIPKMIKEVDLFGDGYQEQTKEEEARAKHDESVRYLEIKAKGIETIANDKKLHATFGKVFSRKIKEDRTIQIIDSSSHVTNIDIRQDKRTTITTNFGEKNRPVYAGTAFLASIVTILSGLHTFFPDAITVAWLPQGLKLSVTLAIFSLIVGLFLLGVAAYLGILTLSRKSDKGKLLSTKVR